ncbi:MAG: hypothetical protein A3G04_01795 [Candidatus Taylorbacteria bacterium RIFCSPLOWO2_12_FULL_44_9]|nr:MAG: hypothetical protein A3G04_01795 [Candidatus Taylorbacteria bacterium RIFCSPLOWO2_12_FULL_44_9]
MFFSNPHGELMLIIDVQSSIVRGSLVYESPLTIPSIIYTHNISIPYKSGGGSSYLIKMATRAVEEITQVVMANIQKESNSDDLPHHVSSVHYVLSSPWVVSQAKTLSMSFEKDTMISRAYITGMIWEERAKMTANTSDDIRVIEEKVFDVRLNGYSVTSWESKHTKELCVSFVVSIAGGRMIDRFVEISQSLVRKKDRVKFHSSLFLQHIGIQKIIPDSSDYVLVHIHGELTDVAIIRARSCSFFGSYPFGIHSIIRAVALETKTTEDVAESTLNLILDGDIDSNKSKEFVFVENMKQRWVDEFKKLLKTSSTPEAALDRVIISARSHEDFFVKSLQLAYPQASPELLVIENILPNVSYEINAERILLTGVYVTAIHSLLK